MEREDYQYDTVHIANVALLETIGQLALIEVAQNYGMVDGGQSIAVRSSFDLPFATPVFLARLGSRSGSTVSQLLKLSLHIDPERLPDFHGNFGPRFGPRTIWDLFDDRLRQAAVAIKAGALPIRSDGMLNRSATALEVGCCIVRVLDFRVWSMVQGIHLPREFPGGLAFPASTSPAPSAPVTSTEKPALAAPFSEFTGGRPSQVAFMRWADIDLGSAK